MNKTQENMCGAGNSHWLDKNGKHGMSEYFWKFKYPCILEATGHTEEEIKNLSDIFGV